MPANIEIPLDLPEIRILKTEMGKREIVITVESTREWAICCQMWQGNSRVPLLWPAVAFAPSANPGLASDH